MLGSERQQRVRSSVRSQDEELQAAALLALTQLMAVDVSFCDANLQLIFTLLHYRHAEKCLLV